MLNYLWSSLRTLKLSSDDDDLESSSDSNDSYYIPRLGGRGMLRSFKEHMLPEARFSLMEVW